MVQTVSSFTVIKRVFLGPLTGQVGWRQIGVVVRPASSFVGLPWASFTSEEGKKTLCPKYVVPKDWCWVYASSRAFSSSSPTHYRQEKVDKQTKPNFRIAKEINTRIIACGKNHDWKGILEIYQKEMEHFSFMNYATAMSQLGRIRPLHRADARLEDLMFNIAMQLQSPGNGTWGAQGMANVLHAVAKMGLRSNGATQCVNSILREENIQIILENGKTQAIANTAWACATLGVQCPTLFKLIDANASYLVENGNPQDISNIAWACATLGFKCRSLFKLIDENASKLVENGIPQNIANTAWACATLGVQCPTLFKLIDANASSIVENGKPQAIANTAWACATLGVQCPTFFKLIDANGSYLVENGNPQNIANTAWSCATLGVQCPTLFKLIDANASSIVENGNAQDISNIAWACATLGFKCRTLFKLIKKNASYLVDNGNPQNIANTAWACATLGFHCRPLFKRIEANASYLVENGIPQNIANTAWACATLGVQCPTLFQLIDENASSLVENGTTQAIANTAWACATLGVECPTLFKLIDANASSLVENGTPQAIANTAWACATLRADCPALFQLIDKSRAFSSSSRENSRQEKVDKQKKPSFKIAKEINTRIITCGKNHDWEGILEIYQREMEHFSFINYATAMSQLGRIRSLHRDDAFLETLMIDIAMQLQRPGNDGTWHARGMANVLHAVAKMGMDSIGATQCINSVLGEENIRIIVESGNPQDIANTAWACAKLGVQCPTLFQLIDANASYLVETGTPQAIANTAWSCAALGVQCPTLFKLIDTNASSLVENGTPQNVASIAWACATLGVECPTLFQLIEQNANKQNKPSFKFAKEINTRIITCGKNHDWKGILEIYQREMEHFSFINYATAMSQLGRIRSLHRDDAFLETLMIDIAMQLQRPGNDGTWHARGMANVLHAVAKMGMDSIGATQCINSVLGEENIRIIVESGNPQAIANTAWACATLGVQCPTLFKLIEANASYLVENGKPQAIANTAWACATLGVQCPTLFQLIDANASSLVENGNPQAIANTAWACATLGVQCPTFFKLIDANASYLVENGNPQAIANTAWACATLGVQCPTFFKLTEANASIPR